VSRAYAEWHPIVGSRFPGSISAPPHPATPDPLPVGGELGFPVPPRTAPPSPPVPRPARSSTTMPHPRLRSPTGVRDHHRARNAGRSPASLGQRATSRPACDPQRQRDRAPDSPPALATAGLGGHRSLSEAAHPLWQARRLASGRRARLDDCKVEARTCRSARPRQACLPLGIAATRQPIRIPHRRRSAGGNRP
jgi:hypothetical protein